MRVRLPPTHRVCSVPRSPPAAPPRLRSAPDTVLLTPYASSNLTQLLADALGGDALVVGLAALLQGDTAVNVPTMKASPPHPARARGPSQLTRVPFPPQVLSMLTKATHYPVSKNKTLANGLLIKYVGVDRCCCCLPQVLLLLLLRPPRPRSCRGLPLLLLTTHY